MDLVVRLFSTQLFPKSGMNSEPHLLSEYGKEVLNVLRKKKIRKVYNSTITGQTPSADGDHAI